MRRLLGLLGCMILLGLRSAFDGSYRLNQRFRRTAPRKNRTRPHARRAGLQIESLEPLTLLNGDALYVWGDPPSDLAGIVRLVDFAKREAITTILYNNYPLPPDAELAPKISYMRANDLGVMALYTDSTRIPDFLGYNNRVQPDAIFDGLWLDFEGPWPGGQAEPTTPADLAIYANAIQAAAPYPVYVSISHHWTEPITYAGATKPAYQHIIDLVSGVDIQTAQDQAPVIVAITEDEVAYAQSQNKIWFDTIETSQSYVLQPFNTFYDDGYLAMKQELIGVQYPGIGTAQFAYHHYRNAFGSEWPGWDTMPPVPGTVMDGPGDDIDSQSSTSTIQANWLGFRDGGGIARYEWAIGTSPGATDVQAFIAVGSATSATATSLNLIEGTAYYVTVKAFDNSGNVSNAASSDGVTVGTPPSASPDAYAVTPGRRLNVPAAKGVLANDERAADAILVTKPKHGRLEFRADGSFDFTPGATYKGFDSFTYKARDAGGALSNIATVQLVPTVQFKVASSKGPESITTVRITVVLAHASRVPVRVHYAVTGGTATPGDDFILHAGDLTIPPRQISGDITLKILNDRVPETNETVQVTLSTPTNAVLGPRKVHTRIILDDDTPRITLHAAGNGYAERTKVWGTVTAIPVRSAARYYVRLYATTDPGSAYPQPFPDSRHALNPTTLTWSTWSRPWYNGLRADLIDKVTGQVVASRSLLPRA